MKKLATLYTVIVLCTGHGILADNDKDKDEDKGKKVPPGLEKKGGVPPGQAKKQGQGQADPTPGSAPAVTAPAPAATPATPSTAAAPAPSVVKPAANEPVKATAAAVKADPKTAPTKPATLAEQKATLDTHARTINQATKSNPTLQKVAFQQISKETGVSVEQLRQQDKNHPDASATSLLLGTLIAKQSGAKFGDLMRAREGGKHWAEIAKARNVEIDPLVKKSAQLAETLRSAQATQAPDSKPVNPFTKSP